MDLMSGFGVVLTIYGVGIFLAGSAFVGLLWWVFG